MDVLYITSMASLRIADHQKSLPKDLAQNTWLQRSSPRIINKSQHPASITPESVVRLKRYYRYCIKESRSYIISSARMEVDQLPSGSRTIGLFLEHFPSSKNASSIRNSIPSYNVNDHTAGLNGGINSPLKGLISSQVMGRLENGCIVALANHQCASKLWVWTRIYHEHLRLPQDESGP